MLGRIRNLTGKRTEACWPKRMPPTIHRAARFVVGPAAGLPIVRVWSLVLPFRTSPLLAASG